MGGVNTHTNLWLESACLSRQGIELYISGRCTDEQASHIEKHLEHCNFCREAVEGFELHPETLEQVDIIDYVLSKRIRKEQKGSVKRRLWLLSSAAALFLLLFSVFTSDFLQQEKNFVSGQISEEQLKPEIEYLTEQSEAIYIPDSEYRNKETNREVAMEEGFSKETLVNRQSQASSTSAQAAKGSQVSRNRSVAEADIGAGEDRIHSESLKGEAGKPAYGRIGNADTVFYSKPVFLRHGRIQSLLSKTKESSSQIFVLVSELPEYADSHGLDFQSFLEKNASVPVYTSSSGQAETVYLDFCILRNGELRDIRLIQGNDPMLNMEAIRLVSLSGNWEPASYQGRKVDSRYFMPVRFRVSDQASSSRLTGQ